MRVYFIGIGGIGLSALARYYLEKGYRVLGSDLAASEITDDLEKRGARIFIGPHRARNLPAEVDMVIYSPAVSESNPELRKARRLKIKCRSYPQALGELTKKYFTIAVCGTHGKSTTTAMVALILVKAGLDPTVIVGTKLKEFGNSNFRMGKTSKSAILVIEADEYKASFLEYWPEMIILTSLEPDHLDYFKNFKNYLNAFKKFILRLPKKGILIANGDDENISNLKSQIREKGIEIQIYSLKQKKEAERIKKILKIPGRHNLSNAMAALRAARALKIPERISFEALSQYRGSWRRFQTKEQRIGGKRIKLIHDYGHHPTEVGVTLEAAREKFPQKRIWCLFQPHQYQRTYYLWQEFIEALGQARVDELIITDIYDVAGREDKAIKKKISSKKLAEAVNAEKGREKIKYIPSVEEAIDFLRKKIKGGEVIIIMGAGSIYSKFNKYFYEKNIE